MANIKGLRLAKQIRHLGYHWLTMEADSLSFARRSQACQLHGNRIHAPAVELHSLAAPWLFYTWAFDLIGPIKPPSRGNIWVLTETECYNKWVEAIALKGTVGSAVTNFIRDNILCLFVDSQAYPLR